MKKIIVLPILALIFTASLIIVSLKSESDWQSGGRSTELRQAIGLPSIAIGTNYEGTRNPLLEIFVRSLYDVPGGYDYVVPSSFIDTPMWQTYFRSITPGFNMTATKGKG